MSITLNAINEQRISQTDGELSTSLKPENAATKIQAATKMQALRRGKVARQEFQKQKEENNTAATKIQEKFRELWEKDILTADSTPPWLRK